MAVEAHDDDADSSLLNEEPEVIETLEIDAIDADDTRIFPAPHLTVIPLLILALVPFGFVFARRAWRTKRYYGHAVIVPRVVPGDEEYHGEGDDGDQTDETGGRAVFEHGEDVGESETRMLLLADSDANEHEAAQHSPSSQHTQAILVAGIEEKPISFSAVRVEAGREHTVTLPTCNGTAGAGEDVLFLSAPDNGASSILSMD